MGKVVFSLEFEDILNEYLYHCETKEFTPNEQFKAVKFADNNRQLGY